MNITNLKIAIAEPSFVIRSGFEVILKRTHNIKIQLIEIPSAELLIDTVKKMQPDLLFINPLFLGNFELLRLKEHINTPIRYIALVSSLLDPATLSQYDENINIYDSVEDIEQKLERLNEQAKDNAEEQQTLSTREKEIVVCVVKGMTNREIADKLFLSTHTVITHRRNIARKLQIRSASGLTIYAIVNKLVELDEINHPHAEI